MPPNRKSNSHHCPGASSGNCRPSKSKPRYCKAHQELCRIHNWIYLIETEKCPRCPTVVSCAYHPNVQYLENEVCPSCQAEQAAAAAEAAAAAAAAADPNTCLYKEWGKCKWIQYCTNHQGVCPAHNELYDKYYGCQSCQAGG